MKKEDFTAESQIEQPILTPVVVDSTDFLTAPLSTDPPPGTALFPRRFSTPGSPMTSEVIPRHGSRPSSWPGNWQPKLPLPGAVNAGFYDGHAELVKLERLWRLNWYVKYQAAAKRPGLP